MIIKGVYAAGLSILDSNKSLDVKATINHITKEILTKVFITFIKKL